MPSRIEYRSPILGFGPGAGAGLNLLFYFYFEMHSSCLCYFMPYSGGEIRTSASAVGGRPAPYSERGLQRSTNVGVLNGVYS